MPDHDPIQPPDRETGIAEIWLAAVAQADGADDRVRDQMGQISDWCADQIGKRPKS